MKNFNFDAASMELRFSPLTVVGVLAVLAWLVTWLAPTLSFMLPIHSLLAIMILMMGITIIFISFKTFREKCTTPMPYKPSKTSTLITKGIYQYSRNPMYVGMLLVLLALNLYLANIVALLIIPAFVIYITRFQIIPEERALRTKFGQAFTDYENSVRRWI